MDVKTLFTVFVIKQLNINSVGLQCVMLYVVNPRRACAARVTVVGSVCVSLCPLLYSSLLECLFASQTIQPTQQPMKVRTYVRFSLKMLRCKARRQIRNGRDGLPLIDLHALRIYLGGTREDATQGVYRLSHAV